MLLLPDSSPSTTRAALQAALLQAPASPESSTYLAGGPLCIVLALLHGCGQLVHCADEDGAGLAQALVGAARGAPVDLQEPRAGLKGSQWPLPPQAPQPQVPGQPARLL